MIGRCVAAAVLLSILTLGPIKSALACRCSEPGPEAAYHRADVVALVQVSEVGSPSADGVIRATGSVQKAWKSTIPATIHIVTGEDCAFHLAPDRTYLLYFAAGTDEFGTYRCRGNHEVMNARPILHWLELYGRRTR
jgi:hypothetical protein